ncbi:MAG: hypothetical protein LAT76_07755, partial [Schleiferiaceae bacterium]|nr:hypothetical protein [Schleiferiaceae bacterium]
MNKICFTIALLITCTIAQGQLPMTLDLDAVLGRAQQQSPSYYASKNRAENSYWAYKTFRAGLLPQLRLNATLPQYTNAIDRIIQPDGSANFRQRELTL